MSTIGHYHHLVDILTGGYKHDLELCLVVDGGLVLIVTMVTDGEYAPLLGG